jgi:hypothetical protein
MICHKYGALYLKYHFVLCENVIAFFVPDKLRSPLFQLMEIVSACIWPIGYIPLSI